MSDNICDFHAYEIYKKNIKGCTGICKWCEYNYILIYGDDEIEPYGDQYRDIDEVCEIEPYDDEEFIEFNQEEYDHIFYNSSDDKFIEYDYL